MKRIAIALTALPLVIPAALAAQQPLSAQAPAAMQAEAALQSDMIAWDFVEGITTEVGPRQAGTPAEARGREWAMNWLRQQGFANVANEPYMMDTWVRGDERATIVSPFPQPMHVTALGNTSATPAGGITAEVVQFLNYADLVAAPAGSLAGKIAFISHDMEPTQDGSGYGFAGPARWTGAGLAASKGAVATVIRSIGTDDHRNPHTGGTSFPDGVAPTPAGALSNPDADNLERMFERANGPITMNLVLTPRSLGRTESGNVVAEIVGREPSLPPVLVACHLDSWDLGTGAIDDASGCGIVAAAAKNVAAAGQPLRTITVLFAGAEETGLWGSKAYAAAHADEPIAVGLESDFGADRIWQFQSNFTESNPDLYRRIADAVAPFGVAPTSIVATGGADINIAREQNTAIIDLQQDGTRYFDLHHTPDDTLDKIDIAQLRQNVAVWTQVVGILANEREPIAR
ncbi:M20/M25/M40 family metallo-hydrolase [Altererythrobacter sp. SALINAS58]|uniref:M20/M25/M40 family metallo-hydrolase n=1 Tax=Alteripontixanthobacter muriae TaxID=2705546 RepID=UPI0015761105|nr:M20/M25/M40 family metallo-hydrolase [Alteripontixanthobacter muriae]NTZ42465.1 M20/M25/M40 family metallo-hydrolase [Alteripontixanthobacter muriae]